MKKILFLKTAFAFFILSLCSVQVKSQCGTPSPETYFTYGLDDVNHPVSTGVTYGVISLERITPINPNDPIPTRKFVSVYATNSYTYDTYSAYVEDYGDDNIYAEFNYNQDDFDYVIYSWEVEYANVAGQIKVCDYNLWSLRASPVYLSLQEKLKVGSESKLPFSQSVQSGPQNENLALAKAMKVQLVNNSGTLMVRSN